MQQGPREGDTLSLQDFQQLLLTNYLQAKRIVMLEAEVARMQTEMAKQVETNA